MQRINTIGLTNLCAALTASVVMLALGGCDAFNRGAPAGAQYLLAPSKQAHVEGSVLGTAMVMRFSAIPPFDGRQFLYKTSDGSWRADAYNGFLSDPSDMICDAAARAMTQSGRFSLVGIQGIAVRADFMLDGVIDAFYADYSDAAHPAAIVEIRSYLLDGRGARTRMIAHMAGKARAPITGSNPVDVSDALSAAVAQALDQIVRGLPVEVEAEKPLAPAGAPKSATGPAGSS